MVTHLAEIHAIHVLLTVTATHVRHTATAMAPLVATALHTVTATHVLPTVTAQLTETAMAVLHAEIVLHTVTATHVLHTATATAQAVAQLAAPHLAR